MGKEEKVDDILKDKSPELLKAKKKAKASRAYKAMDKYIMGPYGPTYTADVTFPESTQLPLKEEAGENTVRRAMTFLPQYLRSVENADKEFDKIFGGMKAMWADDIFDEEDHEIFSDAYLNIVKGLNSLQDVIELKIKELRGEFK